VKARTEKKRGWREVENLAKAVRRRKDKHDLLWWIWQARAVRT
jgi:hypothetical protein